MSTLASIMLPSWDPGDDRDLAFLLALFNVRGGKGDCNFVTVFVDDFFQHLKSFRGLKEGRRKGILDGKRGVDRRDSSVDQCLEVALRYLGQAVQGIDDNRLVIESHAALCGHNAPPWSSVVDISERRSLFMDVQGPRFPGSRGERGVLGRRVVRPADRLGRGLASAGGNGVSPHHNSGGLPQGARAVAGPRPDGNSAISATNGRRRFTHPRYRRLDRQPATRLGRRVAGTYLHCCPFI